MLYDPRLDVAARNRAARRELDSAVLAVVRARGEVSTTSALEHIGWRWRNAAKVEGSLRRLEEQGALVGERRRGAGKGGSGVRFWRLPEGG